MWRGRVLCAPRSHPHQKELNRVWIGQGPFLLCGEDLDKWGATAVCSGIFPAHPGSLSQHMPHKSVFQKGGSGLGTPGAALSEA